PISNCDRRNERRISSHINFPPCRCGRPLFFSCFARIALSRSKPCASARSKILSRISTNSSVTSSLLIPACEAMIASHASSIIRNNIVFNDGRLPTRLCLPSQVSSKHLRLSTSEDRILETILWVRVAKASANLETSASTSSLRSCHPLLSATSHAERCHSLIEFGSFILLRSILVIV